MSDSLIFRDYCNTDKEIKKIEFKNIFRVKSSFLRRKTFVETSFKNNENFTFENCSEKYQNENEINLKFDFLQNKINCSFDKNDSDNKDENNINKDI